MDCPACKKPMVILEFQGVELDFCLACRGCWLDRGELGLILTGRADIPEDWSVVAKRKTKRRCPRCGGKMHAGLLPGTKVEVDFCEAADGLWFDHGELQSVVEARGAQGRSAAISAFCANVFGKGSNAKP